MILREAVTTLQPVRVAEGKVTFDGRKPVRTADAAAEMIRPIIGTQAQEVFGFLAMDSKSRVIAWVEVSRGTLNSSLVHPREVFGPTLRLGNVASIIIAHNHPSGDPTPSQEDIAVTKRLRQAGELLGVRLLDHVIIGASEHYSFRGQGGW